MIRSTLLETVKHQLKFVFYITLIIGLSVSCNKDKINPANELDEDDKSSVLSGNEKVLYEGEFMNGAHPTSGNAKVILEEDNSLSLVFIDFETDSGPDLRVYLAEDNKATGFIEISKEVKNGSVKYKLSDETDAEKMDHVLIWCKAFSVNFGSAVLQKVE